MDRVPFEELQSELARVLRKLGFEEERANLSARLFAETDRDGIHSHGLSRFPRFVRQIREGIVDAEAEPEHVGSFGAWERWNGRRGPGNLNAYAAMERAVELSRTHGMGAVALANTNHWMRGGAYGWQAVDAGVVGVCWTNTMPNLPPWGASDCRVGNNPLVVAVPREEGPLVLDMALSQFSYGTLASYRKSGRPLPADGGYDVSGRLTRDPAAIEASERPLPVGLWKGSGLAIMLDAIAAVLSGGRATCHITPDPIQEADLSQVFLAVDAMPERAVHVVDDIVEFVHGAATTDADTSVYCPGEGTLARRRENLEQGIPVDPDAWAQVKAM